MIHDGDAVGNFERLFLIVGDEDAGDVEFIVQPPEPAAEFFAHPGIERAEGLVEQQDTRLHGESARQSYALPLSAG